MNVSLDDAILPRLAPSEVKEVLDIVEWSVIYFCVSCKAFVLEIQVKALLCANETNFILVLFYFLLFLAKL